MAISTECTGDLEDLDGLETNEKGHVSEMARDAFFKKHRAKLDNRMCFDCSARNNSWVSTSYGIYLCLNCSALHRRMGTHISFVRSAELDSFSKDQLRKMQLGGNGRARTFFKTHGFLDGKPVDYYGRSASNYRTTLEKEVSQYSNRFVGAQDGHSMNSEPQSGSNANQPPGATQVKGSVPVENDAKAKSQVVHHYHAHHSLNTTRVTPPKATARILDFDFDFDFEEPEPVTISPKVKEKKDTTAMSTETQRQSIFPRQNFEKSNYEDSQGYLPARESPTTDRFSGSKAISSQDYFGRSDGDQRDQIAIQASMSKYSHASAISSKALFGHTESEASTKTLDDDTSEQLAFIAERAREGVQKLTQSASEAMTKAQGWLNTSFY